MDVQALGAQNPSLPAVQRARGTGTPAGPEKSAPAPRAPVYDRYDPENRAETTTCDTGDVDRELEKLREKRDSLTQQLQRAAGPEEAEKLDRKLRQVEQELSQKDNDAYRRQHAKFS